MTRIVTDGEMTILAVPVRAAMDEFGNDPKIYGLALFTLGLDFGRTDPVIAARMSEIGQAILTGGEAMSEEMLGTSIALVNLLFAIEDARNEAAQ